MFRISVRRYKNAYLFVWRERREGVGIFIKREGLSIFVKGKRMKCVQNIDQREKVVSKFVKGKRMKCVESIDERVKGKRINVCRCVEY